MLNAQDLTNAFARNVMIIKWQTEGLTNEDSLRQFPNGNCLNWALGHIAVSRDEILEALGEPPEMGEAGSRYKRGSDPLAGADDGVLTLEELLNWLDRSQERIVAVLNKMDEAAFAREIVSGEQRRTVGQNLFFRYFHESYHVGQTEMYRQFAGRGDKII